MDFTLSGSVILRGPVWRVRERKQDGGVGEIPSAALCYSPPIPFKMEENKKSPESRLIRSNASRCEETDIKCPLPKACLKDVNQHISGKWQVQQYHLSSTMFITSRKNTNKTNNNTKKRYILIVLSGTAPQPICRGASFSIRSLYASRCPHLIRRTRAGEEVTYNRNQYPFSHE